MKEPKCTICSGRHYKTFCRQNPKKPIVNRIRRIRPIGKRTEEWLDFRTQWIKDNPPTVNDTYWECYLRNTPMCPRYLEISQLTLDHVIPKSRGKLYKYDTTNIKPACIFCNGQKGSKTL